MKQEYREGFSKALVFWGVLVSLILIFGLVWMQTELFKWNPGEEEEEVVADRTVEVLGEDGAFTPSEITVTEGETVEFVFEVSEDATESHSFYIAELGVGTDVLAPGESESLTYTFNEVGTFAFECTVEGHAEAGMVGQITVEAAETADDHEMDDEDEMDDDHEMDDEEDEDEDVLPGAGNDNEGY